MMISQEIKSILADHANGECANLTGANLTFAYLTNANLTRANLMGAKGIIRLPVGDPRGYEVIAVCHEGWIISAGCRWLSFDEALKHWGESYKGDRDIGDRYLYALEWLRTQEILK